MWLRVPLLPALLLTCATAATATQGPPPSSPPATAPDFRSEQGLARLLDESEARYERASRAVGEAVWRQAAGEAGSGGAPLPRDDALRALAAALADPGLDEALAYWMRRRTMTTDRTLTRRVHMWDRARGVAAVTLDPEIVALESALSARLASYPFTLEGRPVSRAELKRILAEEPDPAVRRKAWTALAAPAGEVATDVRKLIRLRADKTRTGRYRYFHDLIYHAQDLEPYWIFDVMELLTARTNPAYDALLASLRTVLGVKDLGPWDIDFAMTQRARQKGLARIAEAHFKPEGAVIAARKLMAALGFDAARVPLRIEVRPVAAGSTWIPVAIPSDLRSVVSPEPGPFGAIDYYERILREHGRALQASFNGRSAPMLKGYPWVPGTLNGVYAEGMSRAIGDFTRDPLFLTRILGLSTADAALVLEMEKERRLLSFRRLLLGMGIEFTIYANPDADLDGRYRDLAGRALGMEMDGTGSALWAADPSIVSRPVRYQDEVLGSSVAADLHEKLRALFGEKRLDAGTVAPWLIERCYERGEMGSLQDRLGDSIQGGFGFDALLVSMGGLTLSGK